MKSKGCVRGELSVGPPLYPSMNKFSQLSDQGYSSRYSYKTYPVGATGLVNLGNTCFMNSALQCLSHTIPLTRFFLLGKWESEVNHNNPLGMNGLLAKEYADLIYHLWNPSSSRSSFAPREFKSTMGRFNTMFRGYGQQDSQELLQSLLDGLHEDLNRIVKKPYVELPDMDELSDSEKAFKSWEFYSLRNDSIIVDLFQGQYKSRVECIKCGKWSVKFDPFMFLSLPIPGTREIMIKVIVISKSARWTTPDEWLKKTIWLSVTLLKNATIQDLIQKVSQTLDWKSDATVPSLVLELFQSKVYKIYDVHDPVSHIQSTDMVCILEPDTPEESFSNVVWQSQNNLDLLHHPSLIPKEPLEEGVRIPVYFTANQGVSISYGKKIFGVPLFICVPRDIVLRFPKSLYQNWTYEQRQHESIRMMGLYFYKHILFNLTRYLSLVADKDGSVQLSQFLTFLANQGSSIQAFESLFELVMIEREDVQDQDGFYYRDFMNSSSSKHTMYPLSCLNSIEHVNFSENSQEWTSVRISMTGYRILTMDWSQESLENTFGLDVADDSPKSVFNVIFYFLFANEFIYK